MQQSCCAEAHASTLPTVRQLRAAFAGLKTKTYWVRAEVSDIFILLVSVSHITTGSARTHTSRLHPHRVHCTYLRMQ